MSRSRHISSVLSLLLAALALLAFAATATAETRTGEATSPVDSAIPREADLIAAKATYDSTSGEVSFTVTTRSAPGSELEHPPFELGAALGVRTGSTCAFAEIGYPVMQVVSQYDSVQAGWGAVEHEGETVTELEPALKSVVGTKTTLFATSPKLMNQPYDCALIGVIQFNGTFEELDEINFTITVPPPTPPVTPEQPPASSPTGTTSAASQTSPPALLSILNPKPLAAKTGKWKTLKITVANTGGTAVGPIAIKAKASPGVTLRSKTLKLPALLPGQAWPVTLQVKLTGKAQKKSTITLTGSSGGLTATSSVMLKRQG